MRREEDLPLSAPEKHQREMVQLLHSKRPPCPQTLTLSRFSCHRDSAYPHCAILCYLPLPDEPLQNPFALPVTTQPTTATTTSEKTVVVRRLCGDCSETECAGEGANTNVQPILSKLLLTQIFTPKPTLQKLLLTRNLVFAPTLLTKP